MPPVGRLALLVLLVPARMVATADMDRHRELIAHVAEQSVHVSEAAQLTSLNSESAGAEPSVLDAELQTPLPPTEKPSESARGGGSQSPLAQAAAEAVQNATSEAPPKADVYYAADVVPLVRFVVKDQNTDAEEHFMVLLDHVHIEVPVWFVYLFPPMLLGGLLLGWIFCCFRSTRTGFSFRLTVEAGLCFVCLWAEHATKLKAASPWRAWGYVGVLIALLTIWSTCATHFERKDVVGYVFWPLLLIFWAVFALERTMSRKVFRRHTDPIADNYYVSDFLVSFFCGPQTALQETLLLSQVDGDSAEKPRSNRV